MKNIYLILSLNDSESSGAEKAELDKKKLKPLCVRLSEKIILKLY